MDSYACALVYVLVSANWVSYTTSCQCKQLAGACPAQQIHLQAQASASTLATAWHYWTCTKGCEAQKGRKALIKTSTDLHETGSSNGLTTHAAHNCKRQSALHSYAHHFPLSKNQAVKGITYSCYPFPQFVFLMFKEKIPLMRSQMILPITDPKRCKYSKFYINWNATLGLGLCESHLPKLIQNWTKNTFWRLN